MLDAICLFDESNPITYSIFKFQKLSNTDIEKYRQTLICPACSGKAYYRKASKDGKAACFGSRYHQVGCREFKPSQSKEREELHAIEVNQLLVDSDAMIIDFSRQPRLSRGSVNKGKQEPAKLAQNAQTQKPEPTSTSESEAKAADRPSLSTNAKATDSGAGEAELRGGQAASGEKRIAKEGLEKLLHSLMRGSELAESDLWVYTDEKYRWRAKNLFVNFADAEPTETGAPRMYWGTISHVDKELLWLNPADSKEVGIPIDKIAAPLMHKFGLDERRDFEGAAIILFGKCFWNKAKNRKIIQLWSNDLNRIYISKLEENE